MERRGVGGGGMFDEGLFDEREDGSRRFKRMNG
jgi:hypothetical protein